MDHKSLFEPFVKQHPCLFLCERLLLDFNKAEVFLVGGAARDVLLGRPVKDIDVVVRNVDADALEAWLQEHGEVNLVGRQFGVFKFRPFALSGEEHVLDIALPRTEASLTEGAGGYRDFDVQSDPTLAIKDDLSRRDFTVNAFAYNLKTGELIDLFDGQADLDAKLVRTVGSPTERFREDYTRLLRAIRFAIQLDFKIEPRTKRALIKLMPQINAEKNGRFVTAREMVSKELSKILLLNPFSGAELLHESGALKELFPDVHVLRENEKGYFLPLRLLGDVDLSVVLALLLREVKTKTARQSLNAFRFDSLTIGNAIELVEWIQEKKLATTLTSLPPHQFRREVMGAQGDRLMMVLEALDRKDEAKMIKEMIEQYCKNCGVASADEIVPLVHGRDLIENLGVSPGPQIGTLLSQALDLQMRGEGRTKEEVMALLHTSTLT